MDVSRIRALRGPNLWSRNTAIEAIVRCSAEESDITRLPGFEARLHALFPADRERASPYQPSDRRFLEPLIIDVAAIPELQASEAALRLQTSSGYDPDLAPACASTTPGLSSR